MMLRHVVLLSIVGAWMAVHGDFKLRGHVCSRIEVKNETTVAHISKRFSRQVRRTFVGTFYTYYAQEFFNKVVPVYNTTCSVKVIERCCSGWTVDKSGQTCNVHDRHPEVLTCPSSQVFVVYDEKDMSNITWAEPIFRGSYDEALVVRRTILRNELGWGRNIVKYEATSRNNDLTSICVVTITIKPPPPRLTIAGFGNGEIVTIREGEPLNLTCIATHVTDRQTVEWFSSNNQSDIVNMEDDETGVGLYRTLESVASVMTSVVTTVTCRLNDTSRTYNVTLIPEGFACAEGRK